MTIIIIIIIIIIPIERLITKLTILRITHGIGP